MFRRLAPLALLIWELLAGIPSLAAADPPMIASLNPTSGSTDGSTGVQISGTDFLTVTSVTFGGTTADILFQSDTVLFVEAPPHAAGPVDVVVTNPDGSVTETNGFTYFTPDGPAPTVDNVELTSNGNPARGTTLGGTAITITGSNFRKFNDGSGADGDATVRIGTSFATNVVVQSPTIITAVSPPVQGGFGGPAGVVVINSDETFGVMPNSFTYSSMCDPDITENCISLLQVNNGAPPSSIGVEMFSPSAGDIQFSLVNSADPGNRFELAPAVLATDEVKLVFKGTAGFHPVIALGTARFQNQGFQWNDAIDEATVTFQPAATSWNTAGCAPSPGFCPLQSDWDYSSLALIALDDLSDTGESPATTALAQGMFLSTNGQYFSLPDFDAEAGALNFVVGAPSLPATDDGVDDPGDADNNQGFFRFLVPDSIIAGFWNATPADMLDLSNSLVTIGGQPVSPTVTDVPATATSPDGILFEFSGFHYSVEDVAIIIAPTVSSLSPTSGARSGGTAVTITGKNFRTDATVTIGGVAATDVVVVNSTTITARTGAHASGVASVVVTNSDTTADTLAGAFTYHTSAPSFVADADADGKTDLAVFRPATGDWYIRNSSTNYTTSTTQQFGLAGDVPVAGDYDGDGQMDLVVYRPSSGTWFIRQSSTSTAVSHQWGLIGDLPAPGDYDGDGKTDPAVFRRSTASWFVLTSSSNYTGSVVMAFGAQGDIPAPGDYDGDGKTDFTLYRPSSGQWFILRSSTNSTLSWSFDWGLSGDVPVPGDYDGDGVTDVVVYRPGAGQWFILRSMGDFTVSDSFQWGLAGDVPVPSDYDGDGRMDLAVYRPSTGTWYITQSTSDYTTSTSFQWGLSGDVPAPNTAVAHALALHSTLATLVRASDFDADRRADLTVYRPSSGTWFTLGSNTSFATSASYQWGLTNDLPVSHDYDGDWQTDVAVYRPSSGFWYILRSTSGYTASTELQWGLSGDLPAPGDYDGDGKADATVYRPSTGVWYILQSGTTSSAFVSFQWGLSDDVPVPGDYDGDASTDLAVYRPATGEWFIRHSSTGYATSSSFQWGLSGDISVPGDYDGDAKTDLAVYRPSTGEWFIRQSSTGYTTSTSHQWGLNEDVPVPSDFDGDRKTDLAVWRPSTGVWYLLRSSTNLTVFDAVQWGLGGDLPILQRR